MEWTIEDALQYYKNQGAPGDQNALVNLLKEVQEELGGSIPLEVMEVIARHYNCKLTFLQAIIKRYPSLKVSDSRVLEICCGNQCGKSQVLTDFLRENAKTLPRDITVKYSGCMRLCGKGPNVKWRGNILHHVTVSDLKRILSE